MAWARPHRRAEAGDAAPERHQAGREEFVVRALDERVPQRMKKRCAEHRGEDARREVSRVGHEGFTLMDSLEPGRAARRLRPAGSGRARRRGGRSRASGARTEPARLFETGGLALALSSLVEPLRSGDRQHRRRGRRRRFLFRQPRARRRRRGRGDDALGGANLSQRRPRGRHRDPACARAAARGSSGCRRRRSCSRARGSSGGSRSRRPATPSSLIAETLVFGRLAMGETPNRRERERLLARSPRRPARVRRRDAARACRRDPRP